MLLVSSTHTPSPQALEELRTNVLRIRPSISAERLWKRYLTPEDRTRLGGNLEAAYFRLGTAGIWAELRGVTPQRAVVEVTKKLGFLRDEDYVWLLREIGEVLEFDDLLSHTIASGDCVLVERPREAYWNEENIEIDWSLHNALWEFIWELGYHAKIGQPIDTFNFGNKAHRDIVTKRKSRLTTMSEFPIDLSDLIECVSHGKQQLKLPPERIHIFALSGIDTLCEWNP